MNELQARLERLEKRQAKTARALERVKSELKEAETTSVRRKALTIEVGGLHWAKVNLGTDVDNPNGKHYTFDEAQAACPKGWRLPTKDELVQFVEQTTSEWKEINGTKGCLFTDKSNQNTLFIPAAGRREGGSGAFYSAGYNGWVWSSSPYSTAQGYYLNFGYSSGVSPSYSSSRSNGFSVRPVQELPSAKRA